MTRTLAERPWIWSFLGAIVVWLAAVAFTGGHGAGGMLTAALSLAVFTVTVGVGQMFVITLGRGNVYLSLPANIGLASAVAMKSMGGDDSLVALGFMAALACGLAVGVANYLLIRALRIPPIIATLSASFMIQSIDISYGRGRSSRRRASPPSRTYKSQALPCSRSWRRFSPTARMWRAAGRSGAARC